VATESSISTKEKRKKKKKKESLGLLIQFCLHTETEFEQLDFASKD